MLEGRKGKWAAVEKARVLARDNGKKYTAADMKNID
jgi:hypothetical protein